MSVRVELAGRLRAHRARKSRAAGVRHRASDASGSRAEERRSAPVPSQPAAGELPMSYLEPLLGAQN